MALLTGSVCRNHADPLEDVNPAEWRVMTSRMCRGSPRPSAARPDGIRKASLEGEEQQLRPLYFLRNQSWKPEPLNPPPSLFPLPPPTSRKQFIFNK